MGATVADGKVSRAEVSEERADDGSRLKMTPLDDAQRAALNSVAQDGDAHSVELPASVSTE